MFALRILSLFMSQTIMQGDAAGGSCGGGERWSAGKFQCANSFGGGANLHDCGSPERIALGNKCGRRRDDGIWYNSRAGTD